MNRKVAKCQLAYIMVCKWQNSHRLLCLWFKNQEIPVKLCSSCDHVVVGVKNNLVIMQTATGSQSRPIWILISNLSSFVLSSHSLLLHSSYKSKDFEGQLFGVQWYDSIHTSLKRSCVNTDTDIWTIFYTAAQRIALHHKFTLLQSNNPWCRDRNLRTATPHKNTVEYEWSFSPKPFCFKIVHCIILVFVLHCTL